MSTSRSRSSRRRQLISKDCLYKTATHNKLKLITKCDVCSSVRVCLCVRVCCSLISTKIYIEQQFLLIENLSASQPHVSRCLCFSIFQNLFSFFFLFSQFLCGCSCCCWLTGWLADCWLLAVGCRRMHSILHFARCQPTNKDNKYFSWRVEQGEAERGGDSLGFSDFLD